MEESEGYPIPHDNTAYHQKSSGLPLLSLICMAIPRSPPIHDPFQAELDALDFKTDLSEDYVMVRRLAMTRGDAIRNMNLPEKVRMREPSR